jgi:hypothetical protein
MRGDKKLFNSNNRLHVPETLVRDLAFRLSKKSEDLIKQKRRIRRLAQKHRDLAFKTMNNNLTARSQLLSKQSWEEATASLDGLQGCRLWSKFKTLTATHRSSTACMRVKDINDALTTNSAETANEFACVQKTHEGLEFIDHSAPLLKSV